MAGEIVRLTGFQPSTQIDIPTSGGLVQITVADALNWCVPAEAPPAQALRYLLTCKAMGLHPMLKEAELVNIGGKWIVMILKNGYLRMMQRHLLYRGHESGITVVVLGSDGKAIGDLIDMPGTICPPGRAILGGWCRIFVHDRNPLFLRCALHEYQRDTPIWRQSRGMMIRKCTICAAASEFLEMGGSTYDRAEIEGDPVIELRPVHGSDVYEHQYVNVELPSLSPEILAELHREVHRLDATQEEIEGWCRKRDVTCLQELSDTEGRALVNLLSAIPSEDPPATAGPSPSGPAVSNGAGPSPGPPGSPTEVVADLGGQELDSSAWAAQLRQQIPVKCQRIGLVPSEIDRLPALIGQPAGLGLDRMTDSQIIALDHVLNDLARRRGVDPLLVLPAGPMVRPEPKKPRTRKRGEAVQPE
jgi:RecT family